MKRLPYFFWSFAMTLLLMPSLVRADAITFEATVDSPRISLDQIMQLTLTVSGASDNLNPISLPVLDGFSAKYLGPSTSTSITMINGNYQNHSERSFVYELFPNKVGHFQIPPISAVIAGQTYTTQPIDVEVLQNTAQSSSPSQASSGASDQSQAPNAESLKDKILVTVSVGKTNVYLNERIPLIIKLLVNGVPVRDIQYPQFDKSGFTVDDFEKPLQNSQIVNGVRYDTVEFKTNVYPNHLGDITLGPVQIQGNVLYKTSQENQDNNPFGAEIFSNFFDSYATRPVAVTSQPVQLHVSSLPEDNRPEDFSGAIGQFDFQATVSPLQVKVGDPLTLKMGVKGSGNFKNLKMPVFHGDGFKSYDPQIKNGEDEKTAEEVIIPTSADVKEVPALHFSYFDTSIKDYKTITQGPFAIQVTQPNPDQEFKAVGFSNLNPAPSTVAADQLSLGKLFDKACHFLNKLFRSIWFWFSLGFILLAGTSYLLWRRFQDLLRNDPAFRRRHMAVREAKQALISAEEYISMGKTKDLYGLLSKVLRDYLANKWHQSSAALSVQAILSGLKKVSVDEVHIAQVKTLLEQADLVCFAGVQRSSADMRSDLLQAQGLITYFEKILK